MKKIPVMILLLGTILGAVLLVAYVLKAPLHTADSYADSGKKFYDQGKYAEAQVQFFNALQKDASNRNGHYYLALTYLKQENPILAIREFKALLEYHPADIEGNIELGNLYLAGGQFDDSFYRTASDIAAKIRQSDPLNVSALVLSADAAAGMGDYASAIATLNDALTVEPGNLRATLHLGNYLAHEKRFEDAEATLLKAKQASPESKDVLMTLAQSYSTAGDTQKAESVFKEALTSHPTDRDVYSSVAQFYLRLKQTNPAEALLKDVQTKIPTDPQPSLMLAELYAGAGRSSDTSNLLMDLKRRFPRDTVVAKKLATVLIKIDPSRARTEIDELIKNNPKDPEAHILLGQLEFFLKNFDAAAASFNKDFVLNSPHPEPHFFLGDIASRKGLLDQAQQHYQQALTLDRGHLPARVALARLFVQKGMLTDARIEADKVLHADPKYIPARLLKATLDLRQNNPKSAEEEITTLLNENSNDAQVHEQASVYFEAVGKQIEAEKHLLRAYELEPDSGDILNQLIQFYLNRKEPQRAIDAILHINEASRTAFHYELLGLTYTQMRKPEDAERAYRKALEKEPDQTAAQFMVAASYLQNGRVEEGLARLDELIKKNPFDAAALGTKAFLLESQGKYDDAIRYYRESLKINPNVSSFANNLAYLLVERNLDLQESLKWAQSARQLDPENADCADTLGWVYYKSGNLVLARDQLRFAASKKPDDPVVGYHLAMVYLKNKQLDEAEREIKSVLSSNKSFKERQLAEAALAEIVKQRKTS